MDRRSEKRFQLAVAGSLLIVFLPRYAYGQQRLTAWSGLVHESLVPFDRGGDLTDHHELAYAKYFLALTRFDKGHRFQSQRLLDEANRAAAEAPRSSTSIWYWWRPEVLDTLRREVEGRLNNERVNLHPADGRR